MILKCGCEFIMTERTLKTALRIFLRTCKTLSRKPCMNRESTNKVSHTFLNKIYMNVFP